MATPSYLSKIPVLRILFPFVLGILLHRMWHCWWAAAALALLSIAIYTTMVVASRSPAERLKMRSRYIIPVALLAVSLGWLAAILHCPPRLDESQRTGRSLCGRVANLNFTDFSMRLTVDVLDNDLAPCRVLLSTQGCDYTMNAGDLVTWEAALDEVRNSGNPGEMDYASYLLHSHGIRYEQHLKLKQLHPVGHSPTLFTRMASLRRQLQQQVFNTSLSAGAQRFVVALLLGNSRLIDPTTRQEFSAAGVAHVLALSGLHVGFIALIIWLLLFPLDYLGLKKLRLLLTLAAIVLFAVFTGLSPSVVRAAVMIGFVFAAFIFNRRALSLNALAMAALVILLFTPSALYSVGFQLSFITVLAILLFARLPEGLKSRYRWVNAITSTAITSLVAMLATIALSAHYFHTISLMSVLSNLLILPVMLVFMVLAALFLLVTAAGLSWPLLDRAVDTIYHYIHWATQVVNHIPLSHINGVEVSTVGVVIYFIALILLTLWLYRRNLRYLLCAILALAVMWFHSSFLDHHIPKQGMVVFNSFTSTPIMYYHNGKAFVWTPDDEETDSATFCRYYAGFLARYNIHELHFIVNDSTVEGGFIKPPYAHLMGQRLLAVGHGKWRNMTTAQRLELDAIIVTKRFHGTATKLRELYRFDTLIISGAMHCSTLDPLLRECDSLNIPCHNLSKQGAYLLEH